MPARLAKLAGLGAFGASAGLLALYLLLVFITRPQKLGGIDSINAAVTWISLGGVFAALIALHVVLARQLLRLGRGADLRHPL